ncbi:hemopexin domain protein [Ceratobasidium sp. AG-Ba]|nr:hemopexin domain protein [Ceratobasidium sp. AG-Ba]
MVGRAVLNLYSGIIGQTWFFKDDQCVWIDWMPDTSGGKIQYGPTKFTDGIIMNLHKTGFKKIDAILHTNNQDYAYFFCDDQYALVKVIPDVCFPGGILIYSDLGTTTAKISDNWRSLAKAGFSRIDGALMVPGRKNEAYVFSGTKFCRIRFTPYVYDDELLDGPKEILDHWGVIDFDQIEAIFPHPGKEQHAYVFCEDQYVEIRIDEGGPGVRISERSDIAAGWPALRQAGFY